MIAVEVFFLDGMEDFKAEVESVIPPTDKFPFWTLYHAKRENEQRVNFINMNQIYVLSMDGIIIEDPVDTKREEDDQYGAVPPDQVPNLFSKHRD